MEPSRARGNNPELWDRLLEVLDDKLQLGLLDKLRKVTSYHIEDSVLFIEAGTGDDETYLTKTAVSQQLTVFAGDSMGVKEVKVKARKH